MKFKFRLPSVRGLKFRASRVAPGAAVIVGGVCAIASPIVAVIETHKHYDEILTDHRKRLADAEEAEQIKEDEGEPISEKEKKTERVAIYAGTAWKFVKAYALPFTLAVVGVALMGWGAFTFRARYLSTSAALGLATCELRDIKSRFEDTYGKEKAMEFFNGISREVVTTTTTDDDGVETTETRPANVLHSRLISKHPNRIGLYTFFVGPNCHGTWNVSPSYTLSHIRQVEMTMNDRLRTNHFVYLNEVLEALHMDLVKDGYTVGWSTYAGSRFVDFGIDNGNEPANVALINNDSSYDNCCVLDFNCIGDIRDKMYAYQLEDKRAA